METKKMNLNDMPNDVPALWEQYKDLMKKKGITSPKVVIHGGYGKNNTGDDAILHVLISRVFTHFPSAKITVLCHGPQNVNNRYPSHNISAYHFKSWPALKAIFSSNIYIIGGGGIVNKINTYSGYTKWKIFDMKGKFLFIAAFLAKLFGAHTHFYAIGATSFPDPIVKYLARLVLSGANVVSVRDSLSLSNLRTIGIKRAIIQIKDPALSLEPASSEEAWEVLKKWGIKDKAKPLIGLNLRYVRDGITDNNQTIEQAVKLVDFLIKKKDCNIIFIPISQHPTQHYEDDLDFGRQLKQKLSSMNNFFIIEEYPHPTVTMALLGLMDFCILERLHAVILISKMKVPFFVVSYDNKVSEFVKLIGQEEGMITVDEFNKGKWVEKIN